MVKEISLGLMVIVIQVIGLMVIEKVMELFLFLMVEDIKVIGKMMK